MLVKTAIAEVQKVIDTVGDEDAKNRLEKAIDILKQKKSISKKDFVLLITDVMASYSVTNTQW